MMRFRMALLVSVLAFGTTACTVYGGVGGPVVTSGDPMLVEIQPGVWVIEDYDEPVFYADGFYWWYRDDGWYRSSYHTGGWTYVPSAPSIVVRIGQPRGYVHYRGSTGVRVRSGPRGTIVVRDHRNAPRAQPPRDRDEIRRDDRSPRADRRAPDRDRPARADDRRDKNEDKRDKRNKGKPHDDHAPPRHR